MAPLRKKYYGYKVSVIDLRNPSRSDGYNLLTVINHWMDRARKDSKDLGARAKAEKYAKLLAKTIVNPEGDSGSRGQNTYFYEAAEGVLASVMSSLFSQLNSFLDSDLEQVICFDSSIDAETFAKEMCTIFLVLPEEDPTKNFMAGLMIQNLSRALPAADDGAHHPVPPDGRKAAADTGRAESPPQGGVHRHEDRPPSHAHPPAALRGVGGHL